MRCISDGHGVGVERELNMGIYMVSFSTGRVDEMNIYIAEEKSVSWSISTCGNEKSRVMKQRGKTAKMRTNLGTNSTIGPVSGSPSVTFVGRYAGGNDAEGNEDT